MRCSFVAGECVEINSSDFFCNCTTGRAGVHCQDSVDHCDQVTCYNQGVCVSSLINYTCQCLSSSYSGRHCEHVAGSIVLRQFVSRTLGYIAILAISLVVSFVLIMDILKYCCGIDPVGEAREHTRRQNATRWNHDPKRRRFKNRSSPRSTNRITPVSRSFLLAEPI